MTNLSKTILNAFQQHIHTFPPGEALKIMYRMYKVDTESVQLEEISQIVVNVRYERMKRLLAALEGGDYTSEYAQRTPISRRMEARAALYLRMPMLEIVNDALNDLFFNERSNISQSPMMQEMTKNLTAAVAAVDLKALYLNEEVIRTDSSFAVNAVIYLKDLGILADLEEEWLNHFYNMYFVDREKGILKNAETLSDDEYQSVIYSLTHIIIAHSRFYERSIPSDAPIISILDKEVGDILARTTVDIQTEAALCYRLTESEAQYPDSYARLIDASKNGIEWERFDDAEYVMKKNHTLYLGMMLFKDSFVPSVGPDLSTTSFFC